MSDAPAKAPATATDGYPVNGVPGRFGVTGRSYASGEFLLIQATSGGGHAHVYVYRSHVDSERLEFVCAKEDWPTALATLERLDTRACTGNACAQCGYCLAVPNACDAHRACFC